jgi:phosphopantetheinyl transferase (holo-ACP synthase)
MKKNKQELIKDANVLAEEYAFKESVIKKILNDLDSKDKFSEDHMNGMSTIQDLTKEMEEIELKYDNIIKEIKG